MSPAPPLPAGFLRRPFAHRGLHGACVPENSRAAIRAAIAAGYGIELDLQPASDGTPMVFHDAQLARLTHARGPIAGRSAEDLAKLTLTGSDETIPSLAEILQIIQGQVPLLIELKDQSGCFGPGPETLEPAAAALLTNYSGPVAAMSFNPHMVHKLAQYAPKLPRGLTTGVFDAGKSGAMSPQSIARLNSIKDAEYVGASFVSHDHRDLASPSLQNQRAAGRAILCWTIRNPAQEAAARAHADQITFEGYRAPIH
ncbi:MAG: glycerophosphodiester phosphodiesterase family protein [Mangrovicoccus sp.]|nr:glycerophosphodiester phosphodiesterase family protein [Mangrovicoccus sp.]